MALVTLTAWEMAYSICIARPHVVAKPLSLRIQARPKTLSGAADVLVELSDR